MQIVALAAFSVMSRCDLDICVRTWKFTGLLHEVLPIYQPSIAEIRWIIREKFAYNWFELLNGHFLFYVLVSLTFDLCTQQCIQLFYKSLSTNASNLREIGWKTAEKWSNASRTDFQRLFPRDLDFVLWPCRCIEMLYELITIHQPSFIKIGRTMIEKSRLLVFLFCVFVTFTFGLSHLKMYTAL